MTTGTHSKRMAAIGVVGCALLSQACGLADDDGDTHADLYQPVEAGHSPPPQLDAGHLDSAGPPDVGPPPLPDAALPDATAHLDAAQGDGTAPDTSVVDTGAVFSCSPGLMMAPPGPGVCGDSFRGVAEECDDGLGSLMARRSCSAQCQVLDELPIELFGSVEAGVNLPTRTIGGGRHPLAVSDNTIALAYYAAQTNPPSLVMTTFSSKGDANGLLVPFSGGTTVDETSNPVLAAMPCDRYIAAWTELDAPQGDELDIALQLLTTTAVPTGTPAIANVTTSFSQFDPDVIWTGSEVVVAWVDDSNPQTAPDIFYRTFDSSLNPTSGQVPLAVLPDSEADVALAPFAGSWAAAWRDDVGGLETVRVFVGGLAWTIGPPFLPAPVPSKPAITAIDPTHLLVVYTTGVTAGDSGVANASQLQEAVINFGMPGLALGQPLLSTVPSAAGLSQSQPSAVVLGGNAFVAWWTAAAVGDPNGEQLWLKEIPVFGGIPLTNTPEISLPRWAQAEVGDQRSPALAVSPLVSGGAVVAAWDDLGKGLGGIEADLDTAVEFVPVPVLRGGGGGGDGGP